MNETVTKTLLKVPNTEEGRAFLKQLRSYAVPGTRVWARGRGPRKKHGYHGNFIPKTFAEWFGIYISKPAFEEIERKSRQAMWDEAAKRFGHSQVFQELRALSNEIEETRGGRKIYL